MTFFILDWAKRDSNIYTCKHNNIFHTKFANKIDQIYTAIIGALIVNRSVNKTGNKTNKILV